MGSEKRLSPEHIAEILARLTRASASPWELDLEDGEITGLNGGAVAWIAHHGNVRTVLAFGEEFSHADGEFIAHAPDDILALLMDRADLILEIERLKAEKNLGH